MLSAQRVALHLGRAQDKSFHEKVKISRASPSRAPRTLIPGVGGAFPGTAGGMWGTGWQWGVTRGAGAGLQRQGLWRA